jgi:5-methyltetrahydropteroyltriglutamate--homocysteine methyltransferase
MTNHGNPIGSTVLGYPRIGPDRELKRVVERYWAGRIDEAELHRTAKKVRLDTWHELRKSGLDTIPSNTFSYYDHVLDMVSLFGALPRRFTRLGLGDTDTYFAAARGTQDVAALEMTKWFDTNYHYLVPELGPESSFSFAGGKPIDEYREARDLGIETRPVLVGPVTLLLLAKAADDAPGGFRPLELLDSLVPAYAELLAALRAEGAEWVQLDEPAFAADRATGELAALADTYRVLGGLADRPKLLVAGYYGRLGDALGVLASSPVEGIAVDLATDPSAVDEVVGATALRNKEVVAGVVDGRNVWRMDVDAVLSRAATLLGTAGRVGVSTSCSLLHVPYDVMRESGIDRRVRGWLSFARQKLDEVVLVGRALREGTDAVADELARARTVTSDRRAARQFRDRRVRAVLESLRPEHARRAPYAERAAAQQNSLGLPELATTTIGSFPQTPELRRARAAHRRGELPAEEYHRTLRAEIDRVIALQEEIGLDVLVHGEPERNDMVQYFAEQLEGYATTENGWVQSYGSRCVRPPILHADVARPGPMTLDWATYAQSLTDKPVKGVLTGPVTILAWSFVRDDQLLAVTADQVALALRDEVHDLEAAGIRIVQVDEPALRELLPLRAAERKSYLDWAVDAFRLATAGVSGSTQIHTHLCYSEFGDVIDAIDGLDADVTTVEAARSRMEVLHDLRAIGFARGVGPGVYDIHSPRIPDIAEFADLVSAAVAAVPAERLWVNPDCGLKTRSYAETEPALRNMVEAVRQVRAQLH